MESCPACFIPIPIPVFSLSVHETQLFQFFLPYAEIRAFLTSMSPVPEGWYLTNGRLYPFSPLLGPRHKPTPRIRLGERIWRKVVGRHSSRMVLFTNGALFLLRPTTITLLMSSDLPDIVITSSAENTAIYLLVMLQALCLPAVSSGLVDRLLLLITIVRRS